MSKPKTICDGHDQIKRLAKDILLAEGDIKVIDDHANDIIDLCGTVLDMGKRMEDGLVDKKLKINEQTSEIERLTEIVDNYQNEIGDLKKQIDDLEFTIADLKGE